MPQHRFYGLRGEAYGLEKVRIYEQEKEAIAKYFWEVRNKNGKFTARDFGAIAHSKHTVKHGITGGLFTMQYQSSFASAASILAESS